MHNLDRAGFSFYELVEKPSELALPALLERGESFDFALIDGWHTFDHTLLDFFYLDRLLKVGAIIVIDDPILKPVGKALRHIVNYPNYEIIGLVRSRRLWQRKALNAVKRAMHLAVRLIPNRVAHEFFDASVVWPDAVLDLDATMVALRKTGPDEREWNWYVPF